MKKLTLLLALGLLAGHALPQATPAKGAKVAEVPKVTIIAKGHEARDVLGSLFQQAKHSYVLAPNLRTSLYLSLDGVPFDRALEIVCNQANLTWKLQDDVYYVTRTEPTVAPITPPLVQKKVDTPKSKFKPSPALPVPQATLAKRVTTHLTKNDLRTVAAELSRQVGVTIEVENSVPAYKIDAVLLNTSLKFALDEVTRATSLQYVFTARQTILLRRKSA